MPDNTYSNYQDRFITLVNLQIANLPKGLQLKGNEFVIKSEFHITLLAVEYIAEIIDKTRAEELRQEIVAEFNGFVKERPLTQYKLLADDLRLVEKDGARSIIVMVETQDIDELFDRLSKKYQVQLPVQPTHITLYTLLGDEFGIPIFSREDLDKSSQPIQLPEIQKLL